MISRKGISPHISWSRYSKGISLPSSSSERRRAQEPVMRTLTIMSALSSVLVLLAACSGPSGQTPVSKPSDMKFITIVKSMGFNWFRRMETGVQKFAKETGIQAVQQGPSKADAALQVQVIEDAIAQKPQAILVVPFEVEAVEPVLKKAQDQKIVVITHEASNIEAPSATYDIEAFDNAAYGRHIMDEIARGMEYEGQYVVFVGSLTSKSHNEWVNAAITYQKERYPKMQLVGSKNETGDDPQKAYQVMKDLLRTYPDIKGVQGSAATDVVGAAQAIQEAGLASKITVAGTSLPSYAGELLRSGAINVINCWDPAMAGYVMNKVAQMMLEGKKIEDGMNLGVVGYNRIRLAGKVIYGDAWIDINRDNMDQYPF
jgi:simple sugar transport system substrate-binding protein